MQAKDIPDLQMLGLIDKRQHMQQIEWKIDHLPWCHRWALYEELPGVPEKVVDAKCAALIRRGFVTGCTCGCRGDFELTEKGRDYLFPEAQLVAVDGKRLLA